MWIQAHATAMMAAAIVAWYLRTPSLVAAAGAISFLGYVRGSAGKWSPGGSFGLANAVTTIRLSLVLTMLAVGVDWPAFLLTAIALVVILLDGVDGWAARRFETQSEFGARYDYSVDALFTLALSLLLVTRGTLGAWVLVAGAWHYVFVLFTLAVPVRRVEPRWRWGRVIFVVLVSSLSAAFVAPPPLGPALAAGGVLAVSFSFARSFWQSYGPGLRA
jgi:phosphatidylglycerophosphate synthase